MVLAVRLDHESFQTMWPLQRPRRENHLVRVRKLRNYTVPAINELPAQPLTKEEITKLETLEKERKDEERSRKRKEAEERRKDTIKRRKRD